MGRPGGAPENLRPWKKGQSGNPKGSEKGIGVVKRLTQAQVKEVMDLVLTNDVGAIERIRKDPSTPLLQAWICSIALKGFKTGDHSAIEVLLARTIGKLKDNVEITGNVTVAPVTRDALAQAMKRDQFIEVQGRDITDADSQAEPLVTEATHPVNKTMEHEGTCDHSGSDDLRTGLIDHAEVTEARADSQPSDAGPVGSPVADPLRS